MGAPNPGRRLLLQTVRRPDSQIDLVRAALAIAWEDRGTIDMDRVLHRLDALVARTRPHVFPDRPTTEQAQQVVEYLHHVEGFVGTPRVYEDDDPANSYLPEVLERRVGLPILLALLLLHVGRHLGLPLEPANLPGHFMVRCSRPEGDLFLDLFYGRVRENAACRTFLQERIGHAISDPARVPQPSRRQVLARLLRNLKFSYFRREDFPKALAATERILLMEPESSTDVRDRGMLRAHLGDLHRALADLERYAAMDPIAADHEIVRKHAQTLADMLGQRN
jgi:regulator of sirC expression with transglutaminase-like and TPR domain